MTPDPPCQPRPRYPPVKGPGKFRVLFASTGPTDQPPRQILPGSARRQGLSFGVLGDPVQFSPVPWDTDPFSGQTGIQVDAAQRMDLYTWREGVVVQSAWYAYSFTGDSTLVIWEYFD